MKTKKDSKTQTKLAKSQSLPDPEPSLLGSKDNTERRINTFNLVLTIVSVLAAVVSTYFAWQSFQRTPPKENLEDSALTAITDERKQLKFLVIEATISNVGGTSVSLVKSNAKITFEQPLQTPTPSQSLTQPPSPSFVIVTPVVVIKGTSTPLGAEPTIVLSGTTRIVVELPGIQNPDEAIKIFGGTGLLEFIDVNSANSFCLDRNCYTVAETRQRDVFVYAKGSSKLPSNWKKEIPQNIDEDDLPILLGAGESKAIVIILRQLPPSRSARMTGMDIALQFNDGNTITIPLLEKLK